MLLQLWDGFWGGPFRRPFLWRWQAMAGCAAGRGELHHKSRSFLLGSLYVVNEKTLSAPKALHPRAPWHRRLCPPAPPRHCPCQGKGCPGTRRQVGVCPPRRRGGPGQRPPREPAPTEGILKHPSVAVFKFPAHLSPLPRTELHCCGNGGHPTLA